MFTGTLTVGSNQVLKITYANTTSLNAIQSGTQTISGGFILIDDILAAITTDYWLPTGTYSVTGHEIMSFITSGSFKGLISGILYDITP